jgi:antitoxin (DNA-binding transcriptional repressor) of toxin-antitoxin stability system
MDANQVSKSEFKAKALEYFRQIEGSGESVIVTDHGKPALEVRPYRGKDRHPLDILRGSVVSYENPTEPVADSDWEAAQ